MESENALGRTQFAAVSPARVIRHALDEWRPRPTLLQRFHDRQIRPLAPPEPRPTSHPKSASVSVIDHFIPNLFFG